MDVETISKAKSILRRLGVNGDWGIHVVRQTNSYGSIHTHDLSNDFFLLIAIAIVIPFHLTEKNTIAFRST